MEPQASRAHMEARLILAPDDRLPDGPARWSREALGEAWSSCRRDLRAVLLDPGITAVAVLCGVPAAGKSAWSRDNDQPGLVIFDACWADRAKRAGIARQIRAAGKVAIAVWIQTPLDVCRERNALRPHDRRVPDVALARAWVALHHEPPTASEGWSRVLVQDGQAERIHDAAVPPERQLERLARSPANQAWALVRARLLPAYAAARRQANAGPDAPPSSMALALQHFAAAMERGRAGDDQVGRSLGRIGERVEGLERRAWQDQVREHVETFEAEPQGEVVSDWAERVGQQVADVRRRIAPGVDAAIAEAWRKGWTATDLEAHWREHGIPLADGGTAEGQATGIGSEAHAGLVQAVTHANQLDAGCDWYTWEHSGNPNPDPEHLAAHLKRFQWSKRPSFGHPGDRRYCGCRARPFLRPSDIKRLRAEP
jgi:predicted kinase